MYVNISSVSQMSEFCDKDGAHKLSWGNYPFLPERWVIIKRSLRKQERSGTGYAGWMRMNATKLPLEFRGLSLMKMVKELFCRIPQANVCGDVK